jgi:hypothetical protein
MNPVVENKGEVARLGRFERPTSGSGVQAKLAPPLFSCLDSVTWFGKQNPNSDRFTLFGTVLCT